MSTTEQLLLRILRQQLGADAGGVSAQAAFAELGLDSIAGLRFARKAQEALGIEIELEWLYDYPCIAQLATFLDGLTDSSQAISPLDTSQPTDHGR